MIECVVVSESYKSIVYFMRVRHSFTDRVTFIPGVIAEDRKKEAERVELSINNVNDLRGIKFERLGNRLLQEIECGRVLRLFVSFLGSVLYFEKANCGNIIEVSTVPIIADNFATAFSNFDYVCKFLINNGDVTHV